MQLFKTLIVTLAVVMACCGMAKAQIGAGPSPIVSAPSGPNLEETQKWIKEKIEGVRMVNLKAPQWSTDFQIEFQGCRMKTSRYDHRTADQMNEAVNLYNNFTIELALLDARAMDIADLSPMDETNGNDGYSRLWIWTLGRQDVVAFTEVRTPPYINPKPPSKEHNVHFYVQGREMAERLKNAFQHAISLCVKQVADRKAAEPPKPKELF